MQLPVHFLSYIAIAQEQLSSKGELWIAKFRNQQPSQIAGISNSLALSLSEWWSSLQECEKIRRPVLISTLYKGGTVSLTLIYSIETLIISTKGMVTSIGILLIIKFGELQKIEANTVNVYLRMDAFFEMQELYEKLVVRIQDLGVNA